MPDRSEREEERCKGSNNYNNNNGRFPEGVWKKGSSNGDVAFRGRSAGLAGCWQTAN